MPFPIPPPKPDVEYGGYGFRQPESWVMRELLAYNNARSAWFGLVSALWFRGYTMGAFTAPDKITLIPRPGYPAGQSLTIGSKPATNCGR